MRVLVGALLVLDGLASGVRFARFVSVLPIYPPVAVVLLVCRAFVGAALLTSGVWLVQRRPPAAVLARAGLVASAALETLEIGFALAPTSLFSAYRWPVVGLYWMYAAAMVAWIRERESETFNSR